MAEEPAYWIPRVGDQVERYEVVAELARGGMAAVYAVRRRSFGGFGRLLAMKVLLPHLRDERQFIDMFLDEARLASSIHHPNVVQVFDLGQERDTPFLVMELVRGVSLSELMRAAKSKPQKLPISAMLHVLAQAAEGLHAAHETSGADGERLGMVHRDVSPHNVLLSFDGHVKVADFGIAAGRGRISSTRSGEVRGKLGYLAPEQVKRLHGIDRRVDVWALGVVAYEVFAGKKLFADGDDAAILWDIVSGDPIDLGALPEELPEIARKTIERCLVRERADRVATCRELSEAFADAARALGCRGAVEVERLMDELVPERKAALDRRLIDTDSEPPTEPSDPPAGEEAEVSAPLDRDAMTSREIPLAAPARTEQTHTDVAVSSTFAAPPRTRTRAFWAIGAVIAFAAIGVLVSLWFASPEKERVAASVAVPPPIVSASATAASSGSAEAAKTQRVSLVVANDVSIVLVGETLRKDRPVVLELGPGEHVGVKLVSKSGKVSEQQIGVEDDGSTLSTAVRSEPQRPPPAGSVKRPLFSNPY